MLTVGLTLELVPDKVILDTGLVGDEVDPGPNGETPVKPVNEELGVLSEDTLVM